MRQQNNWRGRPYLPRINSAWQEVATLRLPFGVLFLCACLTAHAYQQPETASPPNPVPHSQPSSAISRDTASSDSETQLPAVVLHDGQEVVLRNLDPVTSAKAKIGDPVRFGVIRSVSSDGLVVIPEGTIATGTVQAVGKAGLAHHGGHLSVTLNGIQLSNGQPVQLRAVESRKERNFGWRDVAAATAVAATVYYMPLAPVYLLAKGDQASMPAGTRVTAYLDGDLTVGRAGLEAAGPPPGPNPEAATIYIFRGNQDRTPSIEQPVSCGRLPVGTFSGSQYMKFEVTPGRYWCYSQFHTAKLSPAQQATQLVEFDAAAGQRYYLEVVLVSGKHGITKPTLQKVDESFGAEQVFNAGSRANTLVPESGTNHPAAISATPKGVYAN
jgi:hypothetical protein